MYTAGRLTRRLTWFAAVIGIVIFAGTCCAQFRIFPGRTKAGDKCSPETPARICLGDASTAHCFAPKGDKDYVFSLDPKAKSVGKIGGQVFTLFTATFSGCGSGTLTDFSLLAVRSGEFVNLLPKMQLTNQSEYKVWDLTDVSPLPVLVTADFIWDFEAMQKSNFAEETHFASHRYRIEAFVFDAKSRRYLQKVRYETTKKYLGLDEADEIHVLDSERPVIHARLQKPAG